MTQSEFNQFVLDAFRKLDMNGVLEVARLSDVRIPTSGGYFIKTLLWCSHAGEEEFMTDTNNNLIEFQSLEAARSMCYYADFDRAEIHHDGQIVETYVR